MTDARLYNTIAEKLLDLIRTGVFPPGSRLPGERELAERFGVSRVTIREAEICLQALGHVDVRLGSGAYVLDPPEADAGALPTVGPFELTEARALFEAEAAALAASVITDEALSQMEEALRRMSPANGHDDPTAQDADREFHLIIARASNNPAVQFVVESLWKIRCESPEVQKAYRKICARDTSYREEEHRAVLDALRTRNPDLARQAMRQHFKRLLEELCIVTEEQVIEEVREKTAQSRSRFLLTTGAS